MNGQMQPKQGANNMPPAQQEAPMQQFQQETQETAGVEVSYPVVLNALLPTARDNKDLVNFAYYLHRQRLAKAGKEDPEWVAVRQMVNFCSSTKYRSDDKEMNTSRLGQLYSADIFGGNSYTTLWKKKENLAESIQDCCQRCAECDGTDHPFCPYFLCHVIEKTAETYQISPEVIFEDILGPEKIAFRDQQAYRLKVIPAEEELRGIHAKSAHAAYLLLAGRFLQLRSADEGAVSYTHLPLCRDEDRRSKISEITEFWKTGSGVYSTVIVSDKVSLLQTKTDGCGQCSFEQCPHKLAAYFCWLGQKYGLDPIDLAYHVAAHNTYGGISVADNYQFNKYLTNVRTAPMREESKAEFIKMIHFIAGRKANQSIPFLPFNMVLTTPDREKANELMTDFCNALWHFDYFRCGRENTKSRELYASGNSLEEMCEIYKSAPAGTTFLLYDMPVLCKNEYFKETHHRLLRAMEERRRDTISVMIGDKSENTLFLAQYPAFREKIFTKSLEMLEMDKPSVLASLTEKLEETFTIPEEVRQRLAQYVSVNYPSAPQRSMAYVNDLYEKILFSHYNYDVNADAQLKLADIPYVRPPKSEQEIFEEINHLTGLANVKEELQNINNLVRFNIKMGSSNKNAVNLHMMFTGNPGTGKTTVAKLTAEILHSIGFIQQDKLVVCSGKDLIGPYLGQTTIKTAQKCEEAYNGVLFIDEAYQLNPYTGMEADTYKEECIAELIQQMENNRDKLVVIFAGYTDEMLDFMNRANTGLRSRIGKIIQFPDYSAEELVKIFGNIVRKSGLEMGEGVEEKIYKIFDEARTDTKRFGNARYARNLYERSLIQHAAITARLEKDDPALKILRSDEITLPNL